MTQEQPLATKVAVLENNIQHLEKTVGRLCKAIEKNNEIISRSRGIALGVGLVVSAVWGVGVATWNYFQ